MKNCIVFDGCHFRCALDAQLFDTNWTTFYKIHYYLIALFKAVTVKSAFLSDP